MFDKEIIQRYSTEECVNKLTFIAFIFRTSGDPELLVKFKLYKNRLESRLKTLNPQLNVAAFFTQASASDSFESHFAGFELPRMKW